MSNTDTKGNAPQPHGITPGLGKPNVSRQRLTPFRLYLGAILLSRQIDDDPVKLVEAANAIWKEADRSLKLDGDKPALAHAAGLIISDRISFQEMAERRLVPSSRTSGEIRTAKGVGRAVKEFYDWLLNSLEIRGRQVAQSTDLTYRSKIQEGKRIAVQLQVLRGEIKESLETKQLPHSSLDELANFQRLQRQNIHAERAR